MVLLDERHRVRLIAHLIPYMLFPTELPPIAHQDVEDARIEGT